VINFLEILYLSEFSYNCNCKNRLKLADRDAMKRKFHILAFKLQNVYHYNNAVLNRIIKIADIIRKYARM
jgi:hypothetical protein